MSKTVLSKTLQGPVLHAHFKSMLLRVRKYGSCNNSSPLASQHIQTVEQPTACTVAPPQRILLALTSHCVEVRDLNAEGDLLFTFPTVDHVVKLIHSQNGDYVAALETKSKPSKQRDKLCKGVC